MGIDVSPLLLERARERQPDATFLEADAASLPLDDASVDLAIAYMSLMNMDDMPAAVREIGRVLRPGGRFCFVVVHPLDSSEPELYFEARRYELTAGGVTFRNVHHPLESYAGAVEHGGMLIEAIREPRIPAGAAGLGLSERWRRVPLALVVRALKPADGRQAS